MPEGSLLPVPKGQTTFPDSKLAAQTVLASEPLLTARSTENGHTARGSPACDARHSRRPSTCAMQLQQYCPEVRKLNVPPRAANNYTTEQLLELALGLLDDARREQTDERVTIINNWLTNNFTLEIIRAKVAANKANATINV